MEMGKRYTNRPRNWQTIMSNCKINENGTREAEKIARLNPRQDVSKWTLKVNTITLRFVVDT